MSPQSKMNYFIYISIYKLFSLIKSVIRLQTQLRHCSSYINEHLCNPLRNQYIIVDETVILYFGFTNELFVEMEKL